jgi:hypothetical protein
MSRTISVAGLGDQYRFIDVLVIFIPNMEAELPQMRPVRAEERIQGSDWPPSVMIEVKHIDIQRLQPDLIAHALQPHEEFLALVAE